MVTLEPESCECEKQKTLQIMSWTCVSTFNRKRFILINKSHSISRKLNYNSSRINARKMSFAHAQLWLCHNDSFYRPRKHRLWFFPPHKTDLILSVSNSFIINERQFAIVCRHEKLPVKIFRAMKTKKSFKDSAENSLVLWGCEHIAVELLFHFFLCICHFRFTENSFFLFSEPSKNIKTSNFSINSVECVQYYGLGALILHECKSWHLFT